MSESISDIEVVPKPRRRNKTIVDADYDAKNVHPTTRARWKEKLDKHSKEEIIIESESSVNCEEGSRERCSATVFGQSSKNDILELTSTNHSEISSLDPLSTRDVSLMVMAYSIRYHLTYEARDTLFKMCKIFAGDQFKDWNTSKFVINQLYDPPDKVIKLCFLCLECCASSLPPVSKKSFKKCHVICKCGSEYDSTTQSPNYVITIDIEYQIEILLRDEKIKNFLLKGIRDIGERSNQTGEIRDVYDGALYKRIRKKYSHVSHLVTVNIATDGAPLCNSANKSFWPKQLIINELDPKLRFKYPLLAGLSVDRKEPTPEFMNAYMKHFVDQLNHLSQVGIETTDENGIPITLTIVPFSCSVDFVARPILQNGLQYNGFSGCSYCYHKGVYDHKAMRYPLQENDPDLRTDGSHRKDRENRKKSKKPIPVRGVEGFSVLMTLSTFDMVWEFPVDYLHSELLGVVKYLSDVWTETKILTTKKLKELNERLLKTPPHEIHRFPRAFRDKAKWKATEWRSWLLFYSLVCLQDLIPDTVLDHYALFVESIFILLQDSISEEELKLCEEKLLIFVAQCQEMFGNSVMTFNVHSLLHLVDSVRMTGPLWATSTFPFEGAIFYLEREITGPKGVYDQIAKRSLLRLTFHHTYEKLASSRTCVDFCKSIFSHSECKNALRTSSEIVLLGPRGAAERNGTQVFDRCIYENDVFHSIKYVRPSETNDTFVMLTTKEIGEIQNFILVKGRIYVTLHLFTKVLDEIVSVSHIKRIVSNDSTKTVPIEYIDQKLMYMTVLDSMYVSRLPNTIEIQ